jgi:hypothetical protein
MEGPAGMDMRLLLSQVRGKVAREGLPGLVAGARRALAYRNPADDFDRRHGVDTGGLAHLWRFNLVAAREDSAATGGFYQPVDEATFRRAVAFLRGRERDFTLVDIGTGKGRPLLIGAALGFRECIGVEFAAELAEAARRNIRGLGIANAQVLTQDASAYDFPAEAQVVHVGGATLAPPLLRAVLGNLARVPPPHEVHLVMTRPYHAAVADAHPGFEAEEASGDGLVRRWRLLR